ncbi:MAG: hypothetical protein CL685_00845 [Candidatus Magasanikbacteria bacterium]|nr:hypothetical protein [Candidatus Magasanikbacteria bacterium]
MSFLPKKKKNYIVFWILGIVAILVLFVIAGILFYKKQAPLVEAVFTQIPSYDAQESKKEEKISIIETAQLFGGFQGPKTYLVLFQNNTELRPGGGFIGTYAVVRVENGSVNVVTVEGSGRLDARAPASFQPKPPKQIQEYLGINTWFFRDSNWFPDFEKSAQKALEFYRLEGGVAANDIDMVIGVTPTVLERILAIIGPVTIDNIEFTASNVTEVLEYEVEYDYKKRNIPFEERKRIIQPFFTHIIRAVKRSVLFHLSDYLSLAQDMIQEKHILVYAPNNPERSVVAAYGADGLIQKTDGDFLLWVDTNLAALKTDHAMERVLDYVIKKDSNGVFTSQVRMNYNHTGNFDWRTSRYRTFAKVYVPKGAILTSAEIVHNGNRKNIPLSSIDSGEFLDKTWFGLFISIEPQTQKTVSLSYKLPETIQEQIISGSYSLIIQKQLGTIAHGLTLLLDFGKTIVGANPPEEKVEWGNAEYVMETDLRTDRVFRIELE